MKISLTIYIDPLRLKPEFKLHEVHLKVADAFARILNEEDLIEISAFDIFVDYDQDKAEVPDTVAYDWLRRLNLKSREERRKKSDS